jgi:hypothetical protein
MRKIFQKIESKTLTKLFTRWVDSEWDLELLQMTRSLIEQRENTLNDLLARGNRTEIIGFKRYVPKS